jgi:hypothetical protein
MGQKSTDHSRRCLLAASSKRGPSSSSATKELIKQAQTSLKSARHSTAATPTAKLDDATRDGLREYQRAEGLKVTGTMNNVTLAKMGPCVSSLTN